jgi:predicted TIM-barrel fold metal-dependent hydrolase
MHDLPIVDAHMHLWDLDRLHYGWLQDDPLPNNPAGDISSLAHRHYRLDDYLADAAGWNVVKTVHIECGLPLKDQLAETDWLQDMARTRAYPQAIIAGVVLQAPDVLARLEAQAGRPNVRGVRQIVNWHRDPAKTYTDADLLQDERWRAGFAALARFGLSFDLQIYPSQMPAAAELAALHPTVPLILNHAGMPTDRDRSGLGMWKEGLRLLAARPNVSIKVSGLGMVDRTWTVESIRPFVLGVIDAFGPDRSMFASNFPVDRIHGAFGRHFEAYDEITQDFSPTERRRLFSGTAERIYRI